MSERSSKPSYLRSLVLFWGILWTVSLPLFHIHPEADHHHDEPGHHHGGIAHTVFSSDLGCEYTATAHDQVPEDSDHHYLHSTEPHHAFNHPEIEFALLSEPTDRSLDKLTFAGSALPEVAIALARHLLPTAFPPTLVLSASQCVITGTSPRAPPILSV